MNMTNTHMRRIFAIFLLCTLVGCTRPEKWSSTDFSFTLVKYRWIRDVKGKHKFDNWNQTLQYDILIVTLKIANLTSKPYGWNDDCRLVIKPTGRYLSTLGYRSMDLDEQPLSGQGVLPKGTMQGTLQYPVPVAHKILENANDLVLECGKDIRIVIPKN